MYGKKSESDVINVLSEICDFDDVMLGWGIPPMEIGKYCERFLGDWGDELEYLLMNRKNDDL